MFTVLGQDNTGGIIWGPSVLSEAEGFGLYLTEDNQLVDTVAGERIPAESRADETHAGLADRQAGVVTP